METAARTQTAFRLKNSLLEKLKWNARKANLSLNAYVEETLEAAAGRDFAFPQLSDAFFKENRDLSESFALHNTKLPKEYNGLDGYAQAQLDNHLLMDVKYEENL